MYCNFDNERIAIDRLTKRGASIEVRIGEEFLGILYRDEDEGEVSYSLNISILEKDLQRPVPFERDGAENTEFRYA